ncbi:MAG: hypothetical protein M1409_00960 [Actinobacteria bacterium]|nr:hypothetical protein [Actinomycetota bacterium]
MKLTKEQRVLRTISRKDIEYLPSQIVFADRSRYTEISKALGLGSKNEFDDYLENHFFISFARHDQPMFFRDIKNKIKKLEIEGYAKPDWDNNIIYDDWGVGYKTGIGSFFVSFYPLQKKVDAARLKFMPERIKDAILFVDLNKAVEKYTCPNPIQKNNYYDWIKELKIHSGNYLVWPSGYGGIYERAYHILGWEELMTYIISEPKIVEQIFDKITEYKIEIAKKTIEIGFKMGHTSDDLGTQSAGFFSDKIFKTLFLPRLKRLFEVFKKSNIPIMMHSCGNITQYIPYLINIGLDILEPCQPCMDLKFLKKEYGKDLIFYGGINTQILPFLDTNKTREMVKETIRILGKGGGYIIAPAQEIMNDVPINNIKVLVETIFENGDKIIIHKFSVII